MRLISSSLLFTLLLAALPSILKAQMDIPALSPKASVMATVGLTEISIEWNAPAAKDRTIFGGLVPYGELWRTGANKATAISFSRDVKIAGETIKAGKYSLFTIPNIEKWTIILNKETELWGEGNYKEDQDAIRFEAQPFLIPKRERLTFLITDYDNEKGTISMEWDKFRVSFDVHVGTNEQAMASIDKTLNPSWSQYAQAARYAWEQAGDLDKAENWAIKSVDVQPMWYNNWVLSEVMAAKGNYAGAVKYGQAALELGEKAENFFYKDRVITNLREWQAKTDPKKK